MSKIFFLLVILLLPIWVYSQGTQPSPEMVALAESTTDESGPPMSGQIIPSRPALPIEEALNIAESYVRERKVDISGQYIHTVQLNYDDGSHRKGHYWRVQWMWSSPRMGMEYGLRIYMDRTVYPDPLGP
jgi:hypothetical protein